jgi:hypothetical protein
MDNPEAHGKLPRASSDYSMKPKNVGGYPKGVAIPTPSKISVSYHLKSAGHAPKTKRPAGYTLPILTRPSHAKRLDVIG